MTDSEKSGILLALLGAEPPVEKVVVSRGTRDFLVSLYSLGEIRVLASCPYEFYAIAVAEATAHAFGCKLEDGIG